MVGDQDPFLGISKGMSVGDAVVLRLRGVLDAGSCDAFVDYVDVLAGSGVRRVVLDFAAVYLVDGSGVGALVHLDDRLRRASGGLLLKNIAHHVRRMIESRRTP